MENQSQIRVIIVDDHHIVRSSLRLLLEKHGHVVVAEAASAEEAVMLVPKARPQVVMMDLEMPGSDGLSAARRLHKLTPNAKVIFLSAHDEEKTSWRR